MLMRWTDLQPGDKLKFTEEFRAAVKDSPWFTQRLLNFDILKIIGVDDSDFYGDRICLQLESICMHRFDIWITEEGKMWRSDNVNLPIMFDIVEVL